MIYSNGYNYRNTAPPTHEKKTEANPAKEIVHILRQANKNKRERKII